MKLIKQNIDRKTCAGSATLCPEEPEDMWHAYNLLRPDDRLTASAVRKVATQSASGSTSSQRVHTTLTIKITKLDFDAYASQLHVSGQVAEENKHVKLGSYHTLDLELHRNFTLEKNDGWDSVALDILKESINQDIKAKLWAVVLEEGLANICLITDHQTILRQRVEVRLPVKHAPGGGYDKALSSFYAKTLSTVLRQIDLADPKPLLLASAGYTASKFRTYIKTQASDGKDKQLKNLLPKIITAHTPSSNLQHLSEVLASPAVQKNLADARFSRETHQIERFITLMRADDPRAWYGPREVEACVAHGAVGKGGGVLLISDSLFRSQEIAVRRRWVRLVDEVREQGGEVRVLSSMHESGGRLEGVGGIACILTFPIEGIDEEVEAMGEGEVHWNGQA